MAWHRGRALVRRDTTWNNWVLALVSGVSGSIMRLRHGATMVAGSSTGGIEQQRGGIGCLSRWMIGHG